MNTALTEIVTFQECRENIQWAMKNAATEGYGNRVETILKEHAVRHSSLGGTVTKCDDGTWNIDWDLRCECCGEMVLLGSIDFTDPEVPATRIHQRTRYSEGCKEC